MRPSRLGRLVLPVLALLGAVSLAAPGCGSDATEPAAQASTSTTSSSSSASSSGMGGTGAGGGGAGGAASCGPIGMAYPSAACTACSQAHCCAEAKACAADPTCAAGVGCLDACAGDLMCIKQCAIAQNQGMMPPSLAALDLGICEMKSCTAECKLDDAPCEAAVAGYDPVKCSPCASTKCCAELKANSGLESAELQRCTLLCSDAPCLKDCEDMYPNAVKAQDAALSCIFGTCADSCQSPTGCGALGISDATCASCAVASCCSQLAACLDTACIDFFTCQQGCMGQAKCLETCASLWPGAITGELFSAFNCLGSTCAAACPGNPACGLADGLETKACADCITMSCCAEGAACGDDPACAGLGVCVTLCKGDAACEAKCATDLPAGVMLHDALVACEKASCQGSCP